MVNVTCAGRKLTAEDIDPAREMFAELLIDSSEVQSDGGERCASVGEFIRSEVHYHHQYLRSAASQDWLGYALDNKLHLALMKSLFCCLLSGAGATASGREVERYRCSHQISATVRDQQHVEGGVLR